MLCSNYIVTFSVTYNIYGVFGTVWHTHVSRRGVPNCSEPVRNMFRTWGCSEPIGSAGCPNAGFGLVRSFNGFFETGTKTGGSVL
jgi:hypothetical protein